MPRGGRAPVLEPKVCELASCAITFYPSRQVRYAHRIGRTRRWFCSPAHAEASYPGVPKTRRVG